MELRKYQEDDVRKWADNGCRGGWFWDPGLGKTFSACFLIRRLLKIKKCTRVFISCPAVAVRTWYEFLVKQSGCPEELIYNCSNPKQDKREPLDSEKIIICNYEKLPSRKKQKAHKVTIVLDENGYPVRAQLVKNTHMRKQRVFPEDIDFWVLDESHYLKEASSNAYAFFSNHIKPEHKLLLMSGTPFPNKHISCYTQLSLIKPGVLGRNITEFRKEYCRLVNKEFHLYALQSRFIPLIDKLAAENCCFRSAADHLDIPAITFSNISYSVSPAQKAVINTLLAHNRIEDNILKSRAVSFLMAAQALSGYIDMDVTPQHAQGDVHVQLEFQECDKYNSLAMFIESIGENKAIIWVHFTKTAVRVYEYITEKLGKKAAYFTADHKQGMMDVIEEFVNGETQFLISHPKIIGISVNYFTSIQYMLWYELTYDWAVYEQAVDRIYRSGQEKPTFCYHLCGHKLDEFQLVALKAKKDVHVELGSYPNKAWEENGQ